MNIWFMWDNKTSPINPTNAYLRPNTNGAAGSYDWLDLVSNGIKTYVSSPHCDVRRQQLTIEHKTDPH